MSPASYRAAPPRVGGTRLRDDVGGLKILVGARGAPRLGRRAAPIGSTRQAIGQGHDPTGASAVARLRLIATGGTIASRRTPSGLLADVDGATLLEAAGLGAGGDDPRSQVLDGWEVEVEEVSRSGGYAMRPDDMLRLAARTRSAFDDGADAVVVTHGTDTIEESAFLLDL